MAALLQTFSQAFPCASKSNSILLSRILYQYDWKIINTDSVEHKTPNLPPLFQASQQTTSLFQSSLSLLSTLSQNIFLANCYLLFLGLCLNIFLLFVWKALFHCHFVETSRYTLRYNLLHKDFQ